MAYYGDAQGDSNDMSSHGYLGGGTDNRGKPVTKIVYFSVANPVYPVDVATMHEAFAKVGTTPQRIFIFLKDSNYQGFCDLLSVDEAHSAVAGLNRQYLYDGGANQLTLRTTDRASLQIKAPDWMNWDINSGIPPSIQKAPPGGKGMTGGKGKGKGKGLGESSAYQPYGWGGKGMKGAPVVSAPIGGTPQVSGSERQVTTPVVLFNNLPTLCDTDGNRVVTTDTLFTLAGLYGDCLRVKFLNQPSQALVEMVSVRQAETVRVHLDKISLFGSAVRVHPATNSAVVPGRSEQDKLNFWDYSSSTLHRFSTNPKSYENIASPKPTLVCWGYPESYPETELLPVFANYGTIEQYRLQTKAGNPLQMLLIQLETTDQAAACLVNLHDLSVTSGDRSSNLRLNFAKENLHVSVGDNPASVFNVIIKGLPDDFTNDQLYTLISPFGMPKRYTVWKDKTTHKGRGFALVDYMSMNEAKTAIAGITGQVLPGSNTPLIATSKYVQ